MQYLILFAFLAVVFGQTNLRGSTNDMSELGSFDSESLH